MSKGFQSPGGRDASDSASQSGDFQPVQTSEEVPRWVAAAFEEIAGVTLTLRRLLQAGICADLEAGTALHSAALLAAQIGGLADLSVDRSGGAIVFGDVVDWLGFERATSSPTFTVGGKA